MTEQPIDMVERLFASRGPTLVRRARAMMRSEADAEDAVQDAMLSLLRAPHVLGLAALAALAGLLGLAVMYLWNWLVPGLFGLPALGFWQAVGLLVLCHLLF